VNTTRFNSILLSTGIFLLFVVSYNVLAWKSIESAETLLYAVFFGSLFFHSFNRDPYNCLYFFILWLPFQTFVLSMMSATDIFSNSLITFLAALKELALAVLLTTMLNKRMIQWERLSKGDKLFLLNIAIILLYFVIPDSVFGVSGGLKVRIFGLRASLVTLLLFLVGRYVPYDVAGVTKAIKLLCGVCVLVILFGIVELLFIQRQTLISGLISYNRLKGGDLENLGTVDFSYIVEFGGILVKRMMSFFLSPLGLAYFMIFPFAFVLSAFHQQDVWERKVLPNPLFLLTLIGIAILLSNTRAVIAACLLIVVIVYSGRRSYKGFVVLGLFALVIAVSPLKSIITATTSLEDPSASAHAFAYVMGVERVLSHPLGIGLGQAGPTSFTIKGAGGLYGQDDASVGESLYLTIAMERGLPGLGVFIIFVSYIAWTGKKLSEMNVDELSTILGMAIFLSTAGFMIASIPTEVWLGFQSAGIYWWFAGLAVQRVSHYKLESVR